MAAEQKLKDAKKNTDTKLVEGLTTKEIQDNIWMVGTQLQPVNHLR